MGPSAHSKTGDFLSKAESVGVGCFSNQTCM